MTRSTLLKRNGTTNRQAFKSLLSIVIERERQKERKRKLRQASRITTKNKLRRKKKQKQKQKQRQKQKQKKSSTGATLLLVEKKSIDTADAAIVYNLEGPVAFMA